MSAETETETCLRCGTPYEPGQTVCFKCGAPIGETRSSTQPVPAVRVPRAEQPSRPTPAPVTYAPAPAAPSPASAPVATKETDERALQPANKRARGGLIVLLVCLVVLAAGGGAAYAVRALTAPAPLSSATLYADPHHRFHFQRPTLWLVTPAADGVTITDSDGASTATVTVATPAAGETAQALAGTLATQLGLAGAPAQQIAGQQWEQRAGQVTGADGAVREVVVYVTLHGGDLYTIQVSSPVASYTSTNNLVFEPLLASFAFS